MLLWSFVLSFIIFSFLFFLFWFYPSTSHSETKTTNNVGLPCLKTWQRMLNALVTVFHILVCQYWVLKVSVLELACLWKKIYWRSGASIEPVPKKLRFKYIWLLSAFSPYHTSVIFVLVFPPFNLGLINYIVCTIISFCVVQIQHWWLSGIRFAIPPGIRIQMQYRLRVETLVTEEELWNTLSLAIQNLTFPLCSNQNQNQYL